MKQRQIAALIYCPGRFDFFAYSITLINIQRLRELPRIKLLPWGIIRVVLTNNIQ